MSRNFLKKQQKLSTRAEVPISSRHNHQHARAQPPTVNRQKKTTLKGTAALQYLDSTQQQSLLSHAAPPADTSSTQDDFDNDEYFAGDYAGGGGSNFGSDEDEERDGRAGFLPDGLFGKFTPKRTRYSVKLEQVTTEWHALLPSLFRQFINLRSRSENFAEEIDSEFWNSNEAEQHCKGLCAPSSHRLREILCVEQSRRKPLQRLFSQLTREEEEYQIMLLHQ